MKWLRSDFSDYVFDNGLHFTYLTSLLGRADFFSHFAPTLFDLSAPRFQRKVGKFASSSKPCVSWLSPHISRSLRDVPAEKLLRFSFFFGHPAFGR